MPYQPNSKVETTMKGLLGYLLLPKQKPRERNVGTFSDQSGDATMLPYILYQIQKQLFTGTL